jgi:D-methionine transport system ATP-binding protein
MEAMTYSAVRRPEPSPRDATEPPVVRLDGVSRRFGATAALDDVTLSIGRGEIVGLIGRSGAGKSTLIRCLNGLERPDHGRVEIEGRDITALSERELQPLRRRIGIIFQQFNLLSAKTAAENVALPLKIAGMAKAERHARVEELLDLVGLTEKADAYPAQLSGGQKQRVGIARALAARPALLLSDEATSALDPETTRSILALLQDIRERLGVTILMVTHEMEVVRAIADRVAVIDRGRIVEEGPVWRVFAAPKSPTARSLLAGLRPELPPEIAAGLSPIATGQAVVVVDVAGEVAREPLVSLLSDRLGTPVRLLQGGLEHIRGEPVGRLFLSFPARAATAALDFLAAKGATAELLGHVPGDG